MAPDSSLAYFPCLNFPTHPKEQGDEIESIKNNTLLSGRREIRSYCLISCENLYKELLKINKKIIRLLTEKKEQALSRRGKLKDQQAYEEILKLIRNQRTTI